MGSRRMRRPVAAKTAFMSAGGVGGKPISPSPVGSRWLGRTWTSMLGISSRRRMGKSTKPDRRTRPSWNVVPREAQGRQPEDDAALDLGRDAAVDTTRCGALR